MDNKYIGGLLTAVAALALLHLGYAVPSMLFAGTSLVLLGSLLRRIL